MCSGLDSTGFLFMLPENCEKTGKGSLTKWYRAVRSTLSPCSAYSYSFPVSCWRKLNQDSISVRVYLSQMKNTWEYFFLMLIYSLNVVAWPSGKSHMLYNPSWRWDCVFRVGLGYRLGKLQAAWKSPGDSGCWEGSCGCWEACAVTAKCGLNFH